MVRRFAIEIDVEVEDRENKSDAYIISKLERAVDRFAHKLMDKRGDKITSVSHQVRLEEKY